MLYTVNVAFTKYSTGHLLESPGGRVIQTNSLAQTADGAQYLLAYAWDKGGALVEIPQDETTGNSARPRAEGQEGRP